MTDYSRAIADIKNATTLEDIIAIANRYSAKATGDGAVLYSGRFEIEVNGQKIIREAQQLALDVAKKTGKQIIDTTERGMFLSNDSVRAASKSRPAKPGVFGYWPRIVAP